ncbi:Type I restriction-modification system, specificity subunit S [Limosilactobacillus reuteri]|uniref:Type I restriction-modification system, specificity subunit S n=1 Tax=Limosilactobacillus reuteri TaxID=1598 RepID=A0A0U5JXB9_LIMRT|nr:Type I restriction-modification system, specificity subunit S [Limosilactobacillus reuteri]
MNEQNKKVPTVRFKGFTNDWEQRKLGDIGKSTGGTSIESEFSPYGPYKVINIGSYSEDHSYNDQGIRAVNSDKTQKRILNKYDLTMILNDKTSTGKIIGSVLIIPCDNEYVYNQRTERIEPNANRFSSLFLYHYLNAPIIRKKIISNAQGNTQLYVNWSSISKLNYYIPNLSEQNKIGDFLDKVSKAITLQQRKLELLKEIKKGLLQKMFADKDSKQPVLRFKGFHDDWEQRKLGEVFLYKQGIQVPVEQQYSQKLPGLIRFIRISDIVSSNEPPRFINYHGTNLIKPDDLFMVRYGNPGMISMGYSGVIANNLFRLIPKKNIYTLFFYFLLIFENKRLNSLVSNTTMPALSFKALDTFYVNFPEKLSEQKVIGSLLKKLDSLITLQQRRLTKLNTIKKSLLQQMFI